MKKLTIGGIEGALRGHVPKPIGRYGYSAVMLPLVRGAGGELSLLYEVRADELKKQPGEIAFPGGKMERGETPEQTAVRETCEELCVPESAVRLIRQFDYIVSYSNFTIYSCVGEIDAGALAAEPNRGEVKDTFLVPLSFFVDGEPEVYVNRVAPVIADGFPYERIKFRDGYSWREGQSTVPIYVWREPNTGVERIIWGLTAQLTRRFAEVVRASLLSPQ
ncbi:MAG: CoA pyrophosphatase [Clostridiales Family XIII bacterium]|jgi:8-oxo-dGTP pyrophosphatase MutT (NUDIX family)|nr:CoA pyrophosphatase [Clostridiales Family XIII bacterium]